MVHIHKHTIKRILSALIPACLLLFALVFSGITATADETEETIDSILNVSGGTLHFTCSNAEPEEYEGQSVMGFTVAKGGVIQTTVSLEEEAYLSFYTGRNTGHKLYIYINGQRSQVNGITGFKQHAYQLPAGNYTIAWKTEYPGYSPGVPNPVMYGVKISDTPEGFTPSKVEINDALIDLSPNGEDTFSFTVYPAFLQSMEKTAVSCDPSVVQVTEVGTDTVTVKGLMCGNTSVTLNVGGVTATIPVCVSESRSIPAAQSDHDTPSPDAIASEEELDDDLYKNLYEYREIPVDMDLDHAYFYRYYNLYRYRISENRLETVLTTTRSIEAASVSDGIIYLMEAPKNGVFHVTGYDVFSGTMVYSHDFPAEYGDGAYGFAVDSQRRFYFSTGPDLYTLSEDGEVLSSEIHSTETTRNVGSYYIDCLSPDEKLLAIDCTDARGSHFKCIDDYAYSDLGGAIAMSSIFNTVYAFRPVRNGMLLENDFILNHDRFSGPSGWHFLRGTDYAFSKTGLLVSGENDKTVGTGRFYRIDYEAAGYSDFISLGVPLIDCAACAMDGNLIYIASGENILVYDMETNGIIGSLCVDGGVNKIYHTTEGMYALYFRDNVYYIAKLGEMAEKSTVTRSQHITLTYSQEDVKSNYTAAHTLLTDFGNSSAIYSALPSATSPYAAGELSANAKTDTLKSLNYLRWQYGVNTVTLKSDFLEKSQKGAVLAAQDGTLDHEPVRPEDMDSAFYQDALKGLGAGSINSSLSYSGNLSYGENLYQSIEGFVMDTNNINGGIGHRLSLLSTKGTYTSFGCCGSYNTVTMFEGTSASALGNNEDFYAWPSAGYFPAEEIVRGMEWHVSTDWHTIENLSIVLTYQDTSYEAPLSSYDKYSRAFGFKLPNELYQALTLNGESSRVLDGAEVTVTLSGLSDDVGNDIVVTYPVRFLQINPVSLQHKVKTITGKAATCTEPGLTDGEICEGCGAVLKEQTVIQPLGHDPVTDKGYAATCTEDGLTDGSHCSRCQEVLSEQTVIQPLGHDPVTDKGYAATCTEDGLTDGSHCSRCQEVLSEQTVIPANGHTCENYVSDNNETHSGTCKICHAPVTESHDWKESGRTPATELSEGAVFYRCSVCGAERTEVLSVLDPAFWPFTDVAKVNASGKENWRYPYVKYVYLKGLMSGDRDKDGDGYTTFRPNDDIRRGDFVLILYRMAGSPEVNADENPFTDINPSQYDYTAILWAASEGIVGGYPDGTFGRTKPISREEIAKILYEYASSAGRDVSPASDISGMLDASLFRLDTDNPRWSAGYIAWANAIGMIGGYEEKDEAGNIIGYYIRPKQSATRAECAKMLMVFCETYGFPETDA